MTLKSNIHNAFDGLIDGLDKRLSCQHDLSWLLTQSEIPFKPDYLELGDYAFDPMKKALNTLISTLSPGLWHKMVWPKIYEHVLEVFYQKHFQVAQSLQGVPLSEQKMFLAQINRCFKNAPSRIHQLTFSEIFAFLFACIHAFCAQHGLNQDVFHVEKETHNNAMIQLYDMLTEHYGKKEIPLEVLLFWVIRTNWIDTFEHGVDRSILLFYEELNLMLDNDEEFNLTGKGQGSYQYKKFNRLLDSKPKNILYECDNSGEVFFDLILVSKLINKGHQVTIVGKESPVLNDVTASDIRHLIEANAPKYKEIMLVKEQAKVLSSGSNSTGKLVYLTSSNYQAAYKHAQITILKGQGNFQSMPMGIRKMGKFFPHKYKKPSVYMLGLKSEMIQDGFKRMLQKDRVPDLQLKLLIYFNWKSSTAIV